MPETNDAFGPQMPGPRKQPLTFTGKQKILVVVAGLIVAAVLAWVAISVVLSDDEASAKSLESRFQEECYADLRDQLRDPDSAKFESESGVIIDSDDGQYTFLGEGRAKNGFGGMNNFTVACTAYYDDKNEAFDLKSQITD